MPSGAQRENPAQWLYGHHIDWDANISSAPPIT